MEGQAQVLRRLQRHARDEHALASRCTPQDQRVDDVGTQPVAQHAGAVGQASGEVVHDDDGYAGLEGVEQLGGVQVVVVAVHAVGAEVGGGVGGGGGDALDDGVVDGVLFAPSTWRQDGALR